jgi:hypothetical protein
LAANALVRDTVGTRGPLVMSTAPASGTTKKRRNSGKKTAAKA